MKNTSEDLIAQINHLDKEDLVAILRKIVHMNMGTMARREITRAILGAEDHPLCPIGEDRAIPLREMRELARSQWTDLIDVIIEAALHPTGPFQTRELMLMTSQLMGKTPFFITKQGISRKHKTQIGYILSMSGLERKSHHDKETKRPIKAWKPARGTNQMTRDDRVSMVREILSGYEGNNRTPADLPATHLGDLL